MHVFVATAETLGDRPDDYSYTVDGECGGGSRTGEPGHPAVTTAPRGPDLTLDGYTQAIRDALVREGWLEEGEDDTWVAELAKLQADLAADFEPGTILGVKSRAVTVRR
jgi:hypothetical protein